MSAINNGIGWKFGYHIMETCDDILIAATIEVSTSNTHTEEGVACKGNALFFVIKGDATRRMSWGLQNLKSVISETDLFSIFKEMPHIRIIAM